MHYLVTGGAGFIGSHLVDELLRQKHTVTVIDNFSSGSVDNLPVNQVNLYEADFSNIAQMRFLLEAIDGCFHLAAVSSVQETIHDYPKCHKINFLSTVKLIEALIPRKIPLVYASSAAVYGDRKDPPFAEHMKPSPISPYAADKTNVEIQAKLASNTFGLPSVGLRFFNVYGPRQRPHPNFDGSVVSTFISRLVDNQEINIYGNGKQTRDFIFVDDVVRAMILSMSRANCDGRIMNVCSGNKVSIIELLLTLRSMIPATSLINYLDSREGDLYASHGNPDVAFREIGFQPKISLIEGLKLTSPS